MTLAQIVAGYTTKTPAGKNVNIEALAHDERFRDKVVKEVIGIIKASPKACVLIPAFKSKSGEHLGQLINQLALSLQVRTLVTGDVKNFKRLKAKPSEVIILKQSFREGKELRNQVAQLQDMGVDVSVICCMTHSSQQVRKFTAETDIPVHVLVTLE
ncbi:MAG: hypothetical protein J6W96_06865 [Alphaproteobacteria bacterium]|nr:hypothetical protein [Alphaproteobacteria bacterium]